MCIMYFMVFGIAAFGGDFIKQNFAGISFTYITMIALIISYFKYFILYRGKLKLDKRTKAIVYFEIYGLLMVVFSLVGVNKFFISSDLYSNVFYIPRQAYYLAVLPALILMREDMYMNSLKKNLNRYGDIIFWSIYFLQIITNKKFCVSVPTIFALSALALYNGGTRRTIKNLIKFIVILATPIAVGGELTNIIIRMIYISVFIFKDYKQNVIKIMSFGLICMIIIIYVIPLFSPVFEDIFDANSFWRLRYWNDEIQQFVQSHFLGVGYGTSYATEHFVGQAGNIVGGPFGATAEYTTMEKLFVVGPHNSYITILFRLGLIGSAMFLFMIFSISNAIKKHFKNILPVTIYMFFSAVVIIGVNVGLESPYYLLIFVFALGFAIHDIKNCEKDNKNLGFNKI